MHNMYISRKHFLTNGDLVDEQVARQRLGQHYRYRLIYKDCTQYTMVLEYEVCWSGHEPGV
jgi:hypothetical protein